MMRPIAILADGKWMPVNDGHNAVDDSCAVDPSSSEVDRIVALLSEVIVRAQSLSETDQRRVSDFVEATRATLSATTRLPRQEQKVFENALRDTARKYR